MSMFNYTKNEKWLKRALLYGAVPCYKNMMQTIQNYTGCRRKNGNMPDTPYSLMEGISGDIYFYADLFDA
jgi:hypothetical protein